MYEVGHHMQAVIATVILEWKDCYLMLSTTC